MADKEIRLDINGVTYREDVIVSMITDKRQFDGAPSVGNCICGELDVELVMDNALIGKNAKLEPYIRDRNSGTPWKKKGVFWIYNRKQDEETGSIKIVAYDAIYRSETSYLSSGDQGLWPRTDITVMTEIAERIGTTLSPATIALMTNNYPVPYPGITLEGEAGQTILEPDLDGALTIREVAERIAMYYAGNWIVDNNGQLALVGLSSIPPETYYLVTEKGEAITFGSGEGLTRIVVRNDVEESHHLAIQNGDTLTIGGVRILV